MTIYDVIKIRKTKKSFAHKVAVLAHNGVCHYTYGHKIITWSLDEEMPDIVKHYITSCACEELGIAPLKEILDGR